MRTARNDTPQFTGRHMLGIMLVFFGVIIAVNLTMALLARSSWTGVVVQNTYVASQQFNQKAEDARAQAALGWQSRIEIADGRVRYALVSAEGRTIVLGGGTANFRRPAYASEDASVDLQPLRDGSVEAPQSLRDGIWIGEFLVEAGLERPYREVVRFTLGNGTMGAVR